LETTLHQFLKDSTRANHSSAESHPFQGALANAQLTLDRYTDYLQQLRELHAGFESRLQTAAQSNGDVASVVRPEHYQLQFLDRDLRALSARPDTPFACVKDFVSSELFIKHPVSLLGVLYVLLGSKHGGKFIAHNVKQAYGFGAGGSTYFSPYGENFRDIWQDFTASLNKLELSEEDRNAVLKGASDTFDVFGAIGEEIWKKVKV
jgi:heme oxygenase